jgi:hypothetical protein
VWARKQSSQRVDGHMSALQVAGARRVGLGVMAVVSSESKRCSGDGGDGGDRSGRRTDDVT